LPKARIKGKLPIEIVVRADEASSHVLYATFGPTASPSGLEARAPMSARAGSCHPTGANHHRSPNVPFASCSGKRQFARFPGLIPLWKPEMVRETCLKGDKKKCAQIFPGTLPRPRSFEELLQYGAHAPFGYQHMRLPLEPFWYRARSAIRLRQRPVSRGRIHAGLLPPSMTSGRYRDGRPPGWLGSGLPLWLSRTNRAVSRGVCCATAFKLQTT